MTGRYASPIFKEKVIGMKLVSAKQELLSQELDLKIFQTFCLKSSEVFGYVWFLFESPDKNMPVADGGLVKSWQRYILCDNQGQFLHNYCTFQ